MRIWSLHPKHLDNKGLVACWRETLLAKKVLENRTKGYRNHPQLERFKNHEKPLDAINYYLEQLYLEAKSRNYKFDRKKFTKIEKISKIPVTEGQIQYEKKHLLKKLKIRERKKYDELMNTKVISINKLFTQKDGPIEKWEKI